MNIVNSELKTDIDGFNDMPSRQEILEVIASADVEVEYVDRLDVDYWINNYDTIVIRINEAMSKENIIKTILIFSRLNPDEVQYHKVEQDYVVRFWWD